MGKEAYMKFRSWFMDSDIPSMESIRRCRQKWQEEGHFEGTKRAKRMAEVPGTVEFIRDFGDMM
jgi:hypothetical protein